LIGLIYQQASKTHIWLGKGERDAEVFALFERLALQQPQSANSIGALSKDIDGLLRRPYFQRWWILQEVALSRSRPLHSGRLKMQWHVLEDAINAISDHYRTVDIEPSLSMVRSLIELPKVAGSGDTDGLRGSSLLNLLFRFGSSQCSKGQDHVLALLGLANDCH